MEVIRTIKAGMPGSQQFQKHWGDDLVAFRYRRDTSKHYITTETVVDEREQTHPDVSLNALHSFKGRQLIALPIAFEEDVLRAADKRKVWVMPYCSCPWTTQQGSCGAGREVCRCRDN